MSKIASCPVKLQTVYELVPRVIAGFATILLVCFWINKNEELIWFLWFDFLLRSFALQKYSPLYNLSKIIVINITNSNKKVDVAPKIFAARMGFCITTIFILLLLFNYSLIVFYLSFFLFAFAILESIASICMGCIIYIQLVRIGWIK